MNWYVTVLKKYAVFTGRSRRKEYWMFTLFQIIFFILATIIDSIIGTNIDPLPYGLFYILYALGTFIPSLAVTARRLHDTGRSAWWILISIVPLVGAVVLIVFMCMDSEPGSNKWGANPKLETATIGNDALDGHMAR